MTSPMMAQYESAKKACGDALLLFRMGDFYELFYKDAEVASAKLGLTLTSRDKGANAIPMAGFPHHQLDAYLSKLVQCGLRVAICEQVEDARKAKGLVRREVTRVVTPGTITDHQLLDPKAHNFLAAVCSSPPQRAQQAVFGLAWLEVSTGEFWTTQVSQELLADLFARIHPSELLVPESIRQANAISDLAPQRLATLTDAALTYVPDWTFNFKTALDKLCSHFRVADLSGFGIEEEQQLAISAAGAVIQYAFETQQSTLEYIDVLREYRESNHVQIDQATWRSLEVTSKMRDQSREGTLLSIMDHTVTSMGSRTLGQMLSRPLLSKSAIERRQDAVAELKSKSAWRKTLHDLLKGTHDLERLVAKISSGRVSPRDLFHVQISLEKIPIVKQRLLQVEADLLREIEAELDPCLELCTTLMSALADDPPNHIREIGFIRTGYHNDLDNYRSLATGGKQWIANYQAKVIQETGISSLKVGYNKVFGYYLEATRVHNDKIPETFIRKQTLKNAERYITPELKEYEEKVLSANEKCEEIELEVFDQLRELASAYLIRLKANAQWLAELDVYCGLAELAERRNYCRPELVESPILNIVDGRHPVLDVIEPSGKFVPNDTRLSADDGFLVLITGPNMAGKSTYIRQVALMVLMAQIGSFVPAKQATIGLTDRIFARIGASDELTKGQSTFMVEMTESARILNTASNRSLVILDEIGRGTSTYDGVSLAWAIVEYLHDEIGCRALFATHYHELTELAQSLPGLRNYNVAVKEWEDTIVFMHKIVPGAADRSYGIHVAKLAGVPDKVNRRANQILQQLQAQGDGEVVIRAEKETRKHKPREVQLTLFGPTTHPLIEKIQRLDPHHVTPMDALSMLHQWKSELEDNENSQSKHS
ncbi:MAG TPA: DNA mismatch repair protein MutS [Pirellulaceae bacterium]|nr:DNA mismatch repair protein MutS [Pirellulaceae bacterium]HMO93115.1 DNA mismatch repair protein MutS [Pirellulaceae bacterium]HMP70326.1 DNA mismatch repair protein MutS [Pirellulaceae bacterium]